ncbi:MAG: ATP-binding protein [Microbacterium sp.]
MTDSTAPGGPDFESIIRDAVAADPQNLGLRVDLVELLLEAQPEVAAIEIETLARYGANPQTVAVLRARAAAALLRKRHSAPGATTSPPEPERVAASADPRAQERVVWDVERPQVSLADVAGMIEVKQHLEGAFLAPMRNPELARMFGKQPRGSLLMYGPPGCGKTFIARAIAGELGASFVHATLADIMGEYRGQTEKAIHELFETARRSRPCVIFFDEFDAVGGRRTSGNAFAQGLRMVTGQLLEEFDGVGAANDGVYVLAATNRPWDIDPALRRPGRLDRTVLILPPDEPAREAIIRIGLRDKPAAAIDAADIAKRTAEFSGADLSYVVDTAVEQAFMESLRAGVPRMISTYDLEAAASRVVPSTRSWFEQIKPVLEYGVDDGTFAQLRSYLKQHRI